MGIIVGDFGLVEIGATMLPEIKMFKPDSLEEILNFFILFWFSDEIGHCDFIFFVEEIFYELFDFIIVDLVWNWKYFETGAAGAIDHELEFDVLQVIYLVEIEHIEQNLITQKITSSFVFDLGIGEDSDAGKQLQGVNEPIVIGIPYHEGWLAGSEDMFELGQIDAEIVADWFEGGEVIA